MYRIVPLAICLISMLLPDKAAAQEAATFQTAAGPLKLTLLGHGSVMLEFQNQVIYVDPYSKAHDYNGMPKADQIWITHDHYDHLDPAAINQVTKATTRFVANPGSAAQLPGEVTVLRNGEQAEIDGIRIEAVPAYNVVRERAPGQKYHPQGAGNGYVATCGGFRLYIAGDTEAIPEMAQLRDIDVALVPVMLPYTMSVEEAAKAVQSFKPATVFPYHTSPADARAFAAKLADSSIEVRLPQ